MKTGTRRMWARRMLRAGWLLAPVLSFPKTAVKFLFGRPENCFLTCALSFCMLCIFYIPVKTAMSNRIASANDIEQALSGDACMMELMPRRQRLDYQGSPLTKGNLIDGKRDCELYSKALIQVEEQTRVMKRIGAL
jgi:hypothetical protein